MWLLIGDQYYLYHLFGVTIFTISAFWLFSLHIKVKNYMKNVYQRLQTYIFHKLIDIALSSVMGNYMSGKRGAEDDRKVEVHRRYIAIPYTYMNKNYIVRVPYSRTHRRQMIDYRVYLQTENGEEVNITQQPGCMYLLNADMLGGSSIRVHHTPSGSNEILNNKTIPLTEL